MPSDRKLIYKYETHLSVFEKFSQHYYIGRTFIEPRKSNEVGKISIEQYNAIEEEIYREEIRNAVIKLGKKHIQIESEKDLPFNTMLVPDELLNNQIRGQPPKYKHFLIPNPRSPIHSYFSPQP